MSDPKAISPALGWASLGANFVSSISSDILNYQLAKKQNQWNIEQWNRENAYNLPSAQVQRLRDAGLNPGLIYGSGNIHNTSASSPEMVSGLGHMMPPNLDPMAFAQIDLMNAQAADLRASANSKEKDAELKQWDIKVQEMLNSGGIDPTGKIFDNLRVQNWMKQNDLLDSQNALNVTNWHNLLWNLAVLTNDESMIRGHFSFDADSFSSAVAGLRGDQKERQMAGEIAYWTNETMKAQNAGKEQFNKFVETHKDNVFVQFVLGLLGAIHASGLSLPSMSLSHKW